MIKLKELLNEKKSEQYKQHRNEFIEAVNNFGSLGQNIYKSGKDLKEISETINRIVVWQKYLQWKNRRLV